MNDKDILLVRDAESRPTSDIRGIERLLDAAFGDSPFFGPRVLRTQGAYSWTPAVDIRETDAELVVYAALPGLSKEDVALEVKDNTLTLTGRLKPLGSEEDSWVRRELPRGEFYRAFRLAADVQADKVKASLSNGILEIRLPKAEAARPRKVEIA